MDAFNESLMLLTYVTEVTVLGKEDLDVVLKFDIAGSSLAVRIG